MQYEAERSDCGVWMCGKHESVSRAVAVSVMNALMMNPDDFRTRDKIINAIHDRINGTLDFLEKTHNGD